MNTMKHTLVGMMGLALMIALPAKAQTSPEEVADAFHKAIETADEAAVERLLAPEVMILEGGHAQTSRADYMGGHMKSDMTFIPHMTRTVLDRKATTDGDLAWVVTFSTMKGTYKGKDYDFASREMLVMKKTDGAWQITLVHWADK
ncbi:YybH family protein [Kordiimonas lacus]|uniref:Ketosteroid isomerase homolog n=1 Tax=Kordiimonas lacus TaxID=637679 RepID=A0A1G6UKI9_9PROT|nr:nuclear transport factor 2 family protein [Kordiimonas lacus]SDD41246.1 Ketosteroid isomerase homolog [Kordiimonas lacus]